MYRTGRTSVTVHPVYRARAILAALSAFNVRFSDYRTFEMAA